MFRIIKHINPAFINIFVSRISKNRFTRLVYYGSLLLTLYALLILSKEHRCDWTNSCWKMIKRELCLKKGDNAKVFLESKAANPDLQILS